MCGRLIDLWLQARFAGGKLGLRAAYDHMMTVRNADTRVDITANAFKYQLAKLKKLLLITN